MRDARTSSAAADLALVSVARRSSSAYPSSRRGEISASLDASAAADASILASSAVAAAASLASSAARDWAARAWKACSSAAVLIWMAYTSSSRRAARRLVCSSPLARSRRNAELRAAVSSLDSFACFSKARRSSPLSTAAAS